MVSWTLELAGLTPDSLVLDVGCGNGRYLAAMRARSVEAVGCDLSLGILPADPDGRVVAAEAAALPFPCEQFDVVLAPHMLYHVSDPGAAAIEFDRVLRPGGCCVVVANGAGHLASLRAVVHRAAADIQPGWRWTDHLGDVFSLENGADQLSVAFGDVRCVRPEVPGRAVVTDPEVVAGYVDSVADIYGTELIGSWDNLVKDVRSRVAAIIQRDGAFEVEGDVGAFICR